jgi:hypothetical protein
MESLLSLNVLAAQLLDDYDDLASVQSGTSFIRFVDDVYVVLTLTVWDSSAQSSQIST